MIELIPAIDIIDGKCVRLSQGDYDSKKVYNENPVEVAKEMEAHGIRRLHVVDLDGAASHHVTGGSIAVKNPELFCHWLEVYGSGKIILGADVKDRKIAVNGWKDESACELFPFLKEYVEKGIQKVICTDISCDGMLQGPSIELYKAMLEEHPDLYLIASGGVSSMEDIRALEAAGVPAVIFGKALYEGRITLKEIERMMQDY